jgi:hypothetical protein
MGRVDSRPLSAELEVLLAEATPRDGLTLNRLLRRTGARGAHLLIFLLCIPFMQPVPLPGVSTVFGAAIIYLAVKLGIRLRGGLPAFLGDRRLPSGLRKIIVNGSIRLLRFLERRVRRRGDKWLSWNSARLFNCALIILLALLLSLPLPIAFTNQPPALAIALISLAMMEEDGVLIWYGWAAALLTTVYFVLLGFFGGKLLAWLIELLKRAWAAVN